jgi:hypothetical protein
VDAEEEKGRRKGAAGIGIGKRRRSRRAGGKTGKRGKERRKLKNRWKTTE